MASCSKKSNKEEHEGCSFGQLLKEECHQKTSVEIRSFHNLSDEDQTVYRWRAGIESPHNITTICKYHETFYSDLLFKKNSKCCDPFKWYKKKRKPDGTHNLALETAEQLKSKNIHVIPGCKVCLNCHQQIKDFLDDDTDDVFMDDVDECTTNVFESTVHIAEQRDELNESLGIIGISPLKMHAVSKYSKVKEAC